MVNVDPRTQAELLLAPRQPLARNLANVGSLKLGLGGDAAPGVLSDISQFTGAARKNLLQAIQAKNAIKGLSAAVKAVLSSFDAQRKRLQNGSFVPPDPLLITKTPGVPDVSTFFTFSSLASGEPVPASFNALITQRKTQLQQLLSSFSSAFGRTSTTGVTVIENTNPQPYPHADELDLPDVPKLAQGGKVAQSDSIVKDKMRFAVKGVTIGAGKPSFWKRLLTPDAIASVPTLNPTLNQIFKDRSKAGTWSEPATPFNPQFPYNKVQQTEAGHVFELDDTPGAERVHIFHRSGSFIEFHPDGTLVVKSVKNGYIITMSDQFVKVNGSCHIAVDGNATVYSKSGVDVQCDKDVNVHAKGDFNVFASSINLRAQKTFKADGTQIDLRYITLPFGIMPVSYGMAPIGFAPRVNMGAVSTDFPGSNFDLPSPSMDNTSGFPVPTFGQTSVDTPKENPLSNWSLYTAVGAGAIAYRALHFDTPEEVNDTEMYLSHTAMQSSLGDSTADNRQLGGKLRTINTGLGETSRPAIVYLNFDDFRGRFDYDASFQLANTSFTLGDVVDLALHPDIIQNTYVVGSEFEDTPADTGISTGTGTGGGTPPGGTSEGGSHDRPDNQQV